MKVKKRNNRTDIGTKIVTLRAQHNLTQTEFARMIGTSAFSVSNWEQGRHRPRTMFLGRIAKAFTIPIEELIGSR